MAEFLFLFRGGEGHTMDESSEQWKQHMQRWATWMGDLVQQGKFVGAQPLTLAGRTITGTKKVVTDGPYMEGKELVGGYMICKAENFDEAVIISNGCPILEFENGGVEVREIREMSM